MVTWKISWPEEHGRLQSMGLQRVGYARSHTHIHDICTTFWLVKFLMPRWWAPEIRSRTISYYIVCAQHGVRHICTHSRRSECAEWIISRLSLRAAKIPLLGGGAEGQGGNEGSVMLIVWAISCPLTPISYSTSFKKIDSGVFPPIFLSLWWHHCHDPHGWQFSVTHHFAILVAVHFRG